MRFWVKYKEGTYSGDAAEGMTLDTIWSSQMCWFEPGSMVTITDENGNEKTFVKGELKA